jgi:hypothetical protein
MYLNFDCDIPLEKQERIASLLEYAGAYLIGEESTSIIIDISVEEDFGYDAEAGIADGCEDDYPCDFEIVISNELLNGDEHKLLETLAHEMVHIRQYFTRDLIITSDNKFYWMNNEYPRNEKVTHAEYYSFPWEIEAYGREKEVYYGFLENEKTLKTLMEMD